MANKPQELNIDRVIHAAFPFVDFLHILQLEDYNSRNYFVWIQDRLFKRGFQKVGQITWTTKAKILFGLSFFIYVLAVQQISLLIPTFWWLWLTLVIVSFLIPYVVLLANLIFSLVDVAAKKQTVTKAQQKLLTMPHLTVVAVVGSQGKTSTRQFICQLLDGSKKYHTPAGNHNVALSMARDILQNLDSGTQVYVVEFGELYTGDLVYLYNFLQPKIIVATSVSSQHIGQFGSQRAIDQEFLSLFNAARDATILINEEDVGLKRLKPMIKTPVKTYDSKTLAKDHSKISVLDVPNMKANASAAVAVTKTLGLSDAIISEHLTKLELPDRRLKIERHADITIIDDSYNISPESASAALDYLKTMSGRKVVVTGGIVDQGANEEAANTDYGKQLAGIADVIILADNRLAPSVKKGTERANKKPELIMSSHPSVTPHILEKTLKKGDSVLVQNELPDLYWN